MKLPVHLAGLRAQGVVENEPVGQFELGSMKNFVYLLIDWKSRSCALVDSQADLSPVYDAIRKYSLKLEAVFLTHTHHDHVAGLEAILAAQPNATLYVGTDDEHRIQTKLQKVKRVHRLRNGDAVSVGELKGRAIHTPGHSLGEFSLFVSGYVFTGDTIFIRDCGRTDFPDGSNEQMFESIQKIKALPDDTVILCGHHYQSECATTVGREKIDSPPFRCASVHELAALP